MSVAIKISHALKKFGDAVVIPDFSLEVREGEFFTLLGASGCGKTTLLRMIAGFNSIEGGDFCFNGKRINDIPPYKRNIGMVFQNYAIFPHMNTWKNVAFGLKQRGIPKNEILRRVDEALETVRIKKLWNRMPHNMSGGQQQRIALARAIVIQPDVLLMDEPLSNLDAKLRIEMREAIKEIQKKFKITTVYVTHDQEEALAISDRIAVMKDGIIQQLGEPVDIYQHPRNLFVATFIGQSNILDGKIAVKAGKHVLCLNTGSPDSADGRSYPVPELRADVVDGTAVKVCVRPNEFSIGEKGFSAEAGSRVFFGDTMRYLFRLENGQDITVTSDIHAPIVELGSRIDLSFNSRVINIFDAERGVSLMKDGISHE
jgi:iron(III) transport system ATP-binding protein